ncbi:hypothetical protein FXO38_24272 [Capsicum annuum]|uniref:Ubiquitin-like protease family profile domain-containing protein n=1 Tax=Capsicum annuum TaxID=4072 RepID=A0A2G2YD18_CAPAN|nr:hypothetical protein FXO38_24272 [Capsicum annuum]KAF3650107.1 hypothetical protein FXO37_18650 [Capsicum annuum]PHT67634.1 hypothetical protein T459_27121 [Capsicum annuum]
MELFGATTITRKIILEGGLIVVNDGSGNGSGAAVGANDVALTVFEITNHYDYDILVIQILPLLANVLHVDVTIEASDEEHNITIDNPSTTSKEEEKMEHVSSGEQKNYPFERFNISDEAPKKPTKLINDYSEWIVDELLMHHAGRYCQQQSKVSQNEECLINIIKSFSIPVRLPWHLVDEVYFPSINYGDEFQWVLAVVVLKERHIRVYYSMSRRRHFGTSSEIQKLAKILPTYLDMSGFWDQKVRTDWSMIEAYRDKMNNPFDV